MRIELPEPPLTDGPVTLRPWAEEEAPVLSAAWRDPAIRRWCAVPDDCSEEAARLWIGGQEARRDDGVALDLAIVADRVVGEVGLGPIQWDRRRALMGFWLDAENRGSGLARRAVCLMAEWALEDLPLDAVVAEASAHNPASGWVLAAAGFHIERERDDRQAWIRHR
jgi:RimJ/RimL family protein N-acetyltransferase